METTELREAFDEHYRKTWHSLQEVFSRDEVDVGKVISYLRRKHQLQAISSQGSPLTLKEQLELGISWFNFEPLAGIAEEFLRGNREVNVLWKGYRAQVKSYANRRLEEFEGIQLGVPGSEERRVLYFKLDPAHSDMKLRAMDKLQDAINKELGDGQLVLYPISVERGLLELQCPLLACYVMLTLTDWKKRRLKEHGIEEITCPDEHVRMT